MFVGSGGVRGRGWEEEEEEEEERERDYSIQLKNLKNGEDTYTFISKIG